MPFHKMHGCGNDFIFIDNRELRVPRAAMPVWAVALCRRAFGIGADGLVFLDLPPATLSPKPDYIWHFYNADGSRADMCGNASRCAALLAARLDIAPPRHVLGTDAGPVRAEVDLLTGTACVELPAPKDLRLNIALTLAGMRSIAHFVNTGVPHAVIFVPDAAAVDIATLGPALRYHDAFKPAGANADFAQIVDKGTILLRTYERGVEGETYACGTGAAAAALAAHKLGLTEAAVQVHTSGKECLGISLEGNAVFLSGKAVHVFSGVLTPGAVELD